MLAFGVIWILFVDAKPEIDRKVPVYSLISKLKISNRMTAKEKTLIVNSRPARSVFCYKL